MERLWYRVTYNKNEARLRSCAFPMSRIAAKIFKPIANANIVVT
jgi:hypothetical protein